MEDLIQDFGELRSWALIERDQYPVESSQWTYYQGMAEAFAQAQIITNAQKEIFNDSESLEG